MDLHIQTDYAKEEEEKKKSFGEQTFDFAFEGCSRKPKTTAQLFTLITESASRSNKNEPSLGKYNSETHTNIG